MKTSYIVIGIALVIAVGGGIFLLGKPKESATQQERSQVVAKDTNKSEEAIMEIGYAIIS